MPNKINENQLPKTEEEWKKKISPEEYQVLRSKGTERAFCGLLLDNKKKGKYVCAGCENELFNSGTKFESGTGWPSFFKPISESSIETKNDYKLILPRTEVICKKCKSHLGHVFNDGPRLGGKRFCMNSIALKFKEEK